MSASVKYPFTKCLNPSKIHNPYTKEWIVVPCGHCLACSQQKDLLSTLKCKLESLSHRYCMFVTLTYAPEYVPQSILVKVNDTRYLVNTTERLCEGEILGEVSSTDAHIDMIQKKIGLPYIPHLAKLDVQLFIKRLRKRIKNEKIRYYLVGEYGPVHFRPHYHILLWFSQQQTFEEIGKNILESWEYGRVDTQLAEGDCASYVAKYLNSSCNLPQVLRLQKSRPFSVHSIRLGETILRDAKEKVYQTPPVEFAKRSIPLNGAPTDFVVWRSFKTYYYPKCRRYDQSTGIERDYAYQTYAIAREWTKKVRVSEQAKVITDLLFQNPTLYVSRHQAFDRGWYNQMCYYHRLTYFDPFNYTPEEHYEKVYRSVYLDLSISKHFLTFVCDNPNDFRNKRNLIDNFYKQLDYENLKEMYDSMAYFTETYDMDMYKYYFVDYFDKDEIARLKPAIEFHKSVLHNSVNYQKHKKLNDMNKIFNNI